MKWYKEEKLFLSIRLGFASDCSKKTTYRRSKHIYEKYIYLFFSQSGLGLPPEQYHRKRLWTWEHRFGVIHTSFEFKHMKQFSCILQSNSLFNSLSSGKGIYSVVWLCYKWHFHYGRKEGSHLQLITHSLCFAACQSQFKVSVCVRKRNM